MPNDEDLDYKITMYERIVSDPYVKSQAWAFADAAQTDGDPMLTDGDIEAARRYLRACILKMGVIEAGNLDVQAAAALWARGAAGAAAYRTSRKGGGRGVTRSDAHPEGVRRRRDSDR